MATSRCVRLMLVTMANDLKEVWIADQPFLLMFYLWQYMPTLAWWLTNKAAKRRIENFKSGVVSPIYTFLNSYQSCSKTWNFPMLKNFSYCLPISWYINKYKRYKKFSILNAYLSVHCKLLLVLEKVFYKVKIKSKIATFFFCVAIWPVYVPKCFFSTMSPHKLQPILQVSTFCVTSLGWYLAFLLFLPRTRCTSALCQSASTLVRDIVSPVVLVPLTLFQKVSLHIWNVPKFMLRKTCW